MFGMNLRSDIACDHKLLIDAINELEENDRKIIMYYYGIGDECYTIARIGLLLKASRSTVIRRIAKSLEKLRLSMLTTSERTFDFTMFEIKTTWYYEPIICPHCNAEGGGGVMKRWHFDNCKQKEINNE